jgi:glutathione S-transferase
MELWHAWSCPYSMRVRAALAEKGIPYRSREIEAPNRLSDFLRVNPGTNAPVLVDGEQTVAGPLAILEHLDRRWPEPPVFPARPGRSAVEAACERVNALFEPHLAGILRGSPDERVRALGATRLAMEVLDREVPEGGYLLGEFSAADLALASFVARLPRDWRPAPLGFERLARWERMAMSRPAIREQMGPRAAG